MKAINKLIELNLLCWFSLIAGIKRGWASRQDIINYAVSMLNDKTDYDIILIAGGEEYDDLELKLRIKNYINSQYPNNQKQEELFQLAYEKWRLAHLLILSENEFSFEQNLEQLQEIYAMFDYPEDMKSCSIYSQDEIDPIIAMGKVIDDLKIKFSIQ
ncbi:MAG: DUF2247 family protein [Deltaproteobacteria bacterium]|nr:DUF2247 family protein [Deltaproteobacteria bacterium]